MTETDPRQIKKDSRGNVRAKCSYCGKWVSLVHKTKKHPFGSRLHDHKVNGRTCFGNPAFLSSN